MDIVATTRTRNVYLRELNDAGEPTGNALMVPAGWCDYFKRANGFVAGPDTVIPNQDDDVPEMFCWAPLWNTPDSEIDTMWIPIKDLERYPEITEHDARALHPRMFTDFQALNDV